MSLVQPLRRHGEQTNIMYGLSVELAQHMVSMTRSATVPLHSLGFSSSKGRLHLQGQRTDKAMQS